MPQKGIQFQIPPGQSVQQVFQSTGSIRVLNPNDGVCYVALDRVASFTDWDHKLPSQSVGHFPGPLNNYISVYYQDQSGLGTAGAVVLYQSTDAIDLPFFAAIGRAIQSQVTTLDIVQGVQPGNPPAGVTRLWSDTNGNVYHLSNTGVNCEFIDTCNAPSLIGGLALGGDLYGSINNGHIGLVFGSAIRAYDSHGTLRSILDDSSGDTTRIWSLGTGIQFVTNGGTQVVYIDNSGNVSIGSSLFIGTNQWVFFGTGNTNGIISDNTNLYIRTNGAVYIQNTGGSVTALFCAMANTTGVRSAGDITTFRNATSGVIYFGSNQTNYLYWDGSNYNLVSGNLIVGGAITATGGAITASGNVVAGNGQVVLSSGGTVDCSSWIRAQGNSFYIGTGGMVILGDGSNIHYRCAVGAVHSFEDTSAGLEGVTAGWFGANQARTGGYGVSLNNNSGQVGRVIAFAYDTYSSIDNKAEIAPIPSPLDIVTNPNLHGVTYVPIDPTIEGAIPAPGEPTYGFIADEWGPIVPEVVTFDDTGKPISMDYARVGAITFQGLKELTARVTSLETRVSKLEGAPA